MASDQEPCRVKGNRQVSGLKPIFRRPKAIEDVEQHATYIADGSIDAALRFLERFYNPKRLHSALSYVSPNEFEQRLLLK